MFNEVHTRSVGGKVEACVGFCVVHSPLATFMTTIADLPDVVGFLDLFWCCCVGFHVVVLSIRWVCQLGNHFDVHYFTINYQQICKVVTATIDALHLNKVCPAKLRCELCAVLFYFGDAVGGVVCGEGCVGFHT